MMYIMKALILNEYGGPEKFLMREVSIAKPGDNDASLKIMPSSHGHLKDKQVPDRMEVVLEKAVSRTGHCC